MEDRASPKPLFSSGCEIEREDEDDVLVEQESRGEEIADRLFHSDDDDEKSMSDMTSPL